jgi:hypothetical protein
MRLPVSQAFTSCLDYAKVVGKFLLAPMLCIAPCGQSLDQLIVLLGRHHQRITSHLTDSGDYRGGAGENEWHHFSEFTSAATDPADFNLSTRTHRKGVQVNETLSPAAAGVAPGVGTDSDSAFISITADSHFLDFYSEGM